MRAFWLSLVATTLAVAPLGSVAKAASSDRNLLVAQADDDDGDGDDDDAASTAEGGAAVIDTAPSPMAPAEPPMAGMPASALNGDQLGLPKLSRSSQDIPELVLGAPDKPYAFSHRDFILRAGQGYRWKIASSGNLEYKFHAPDFFRNIWFNQIVISDLEVHMAGPPAWLEYDAAGAITVQFNTVRPGNFSWYVEGLDGAQGMKGTITVVP